MVDRTLALAHLTMLEATPLQLFNAAEAGRFDAIGVRLVSPGAPLAQNVVGNRQAIRDIKERTASTGIRVLDVEAFVLGATPAFELFEPALETAAEIGASRLLAVGGDSDDARLAAHLAQLADIARRYDIRVGLEFIPYMSVRTVADAVRILAIAAHPNAGLLVDALHLSRSRGDPADLAGIDAESFVYAQLCDARAAIPPLADLPVEARTDRLPIGQGSLWLDRLIDVLPAELALSVEAPVKAHAGLSFSERGRLAGDALRDFLGHHSAER